MLGPDSVLNLCEALNHVRFMKALRELSRSTSTNETQRHGGAVSLTMVQHAQYVDSTSVARMVSLRKGSFTFTICVP